MNTNSIRTKIAVVLCGVFAFGACTASETTSEQSATPTTAAGTDRQGEHSSPTASSVTAHVNSGGAPEDATEPQEANTEPELTATTTWEAAEPLDEPLFNDVPDADTKFVDVGSGPVGSDIKFGSEAADIIAQQPAHIQQTVADNAGVSVEELHHTLNSDDTMFVTGDASVGYIEPAAYDNGTSTPQASHAAPAGVDVFALASKPDSTKTILLDFDGHDFAGGRWKQSFNLDPFRAEPYSVDSDINTFSNVEQDNIYEIWQRVSDAYSPFDVSTLR